MFTWFKHFTREVDQGVSRQGKSSGPLTLLKWVRHPFGWQALAESALLTALTCRSGSMSGFAIEARQLENPSDKVGGGMWGLF